MKKILFFVGGRHLTFDPAAGQWAELKVEQGPPHVLWGAMCYDPVNDEVVLFGGGAMCEDNRPGTWLFAVKDGRWRKLDQPLAEQPPARCNAPLAYDSKNKLIAVFGGDAQDRFLADTWAYDCAKRRWRELKTNVSPHPRIAPALCFVEKHGVFLMGGAVPGKAGADETWTLDAAAGKWTRVAGKFPAGFWNSALYDARRERVVCYQAAGRYASASKELLVWQYPVGAPFEAAGEGTLAPAEPVRLYHSPAWYSQGLEPPDPKAGEKFIQSLPANQWTRVPTDKSASMRTWGAAALDSDRHEVLYWGGGHCGYCGTDVSHFSLKTLRWTTSFQPEFPPAPYNAFYGEDSGFQISCRSFSGRPWVQHGRTSYAYDPVSRMVVFTQSISAVPQRDWTYLYDPEKRDFVDRFAQAFMPGHSVSGAVTSTPHGVFNYLTPGDHRSSQVGLFKLDAKERKWVNLSDGKATVPCPEHNRMIYDSRRDRLIVASFAGDRAAPKPALYAWDLAGQTKDWVKLEMAGEPPPAFYRECVYVAKHDRILNLNAAGLFACDLAKGNTWSRVAVELPEKVKVGPNTAMVYDPKLDVLVLISGGNTGPAPVWLMRYAP